MNTETQSTNVKKQTVKLVLPTPIASPQPVDQKHYVIHLFPSRMAMFGVRVRKVGKN